MDTPIDAPSMRSLSDAKIALKVAEQLNSWKKCKESLIQFNTESKKTDIEVVWDDFQTGTRLDFPVPYQYAMDYVERMIRDTENQLIELGFKLPS